MSLTPEEETAIASAALAAIEAIIKAFLAAKSGAVKPQDALDHLSTLVTSLGAQDAVAENALDDKFPPGAP